MIYQEPVRPNIELHYTLYSFTPLHTYTLLSYNKETVKSIKSKVMWWWVLSRQILYRPTTLSIYRNSQLTDTDRFCITCQQIKEKSIVKVSWSWRCYQRRLSLLRDRYPGGRSLSISAIFSCLQVCKHR